MALDVDAAALLPPDDSAYGFDNIADVLGVSPSLQERYLAAAAKISALAVGDPDTAPPSDTYRVRGDCRRTSTSMGCRSARSAACSSPHVFPLDGEYVIQIRLFRTNFDNPRGLEYPHEFEITLDGERVHHATIGGAADFERRIRRCRTKRPTPSMQRLPFACRVKAGPHDVVAAFVEKCADDGCHAAAVRFSRARPTRSTGRAARMSGRDGHGAIQRRPDRETRRAGGGSSPAGLPVVGRRRLVRGKLSRRWPGARSAAPVNEADMQPLLAFYRSGRAGRPLRARHRAGAAAASWPARSSSSASERDPAELAPGAVHRVSDVELASRLSFFLWSSIPDDELLETRPPGRLKEPAVLERQVRRMLADPKAQALVSQLRRPVAAPAQPRATRCRTPTSFRTSTTTCGRRSSARPSCSSRASCARTAASLDLLTRRLHVRQRAAGAGTTESRTSTAASSAACR